MLTQQLLSLIEQQECVVQMTHVNDVTRDDVSRGVFPENVHDRKEENGVFVCVRVGK